MSSSQAVEGIILPDQAIAVCLVRRRDDIASTTLRQAPDARRDPDVWVPGRTTVLNGQLVELLLEDAQFSLIRTIDDGVEGFIKSEYLLKQTDAAARQDSRQEAAPKSRAASSAQGLRRRSGPEEPTAPKTARDATSLNPRQVVASRSRPTSSALRQRRPRTRDAASSSPVARGSATHPDQQVAEARGVSSRPTLPPISSKPTVGRRPASGPSMVGRRPASIPASPSRAGPSRRSSQSVWSTSSSAQLPALKVGRTWQEYVPDAQSVMVIGPGAGLGQNAGVYRELEVAGYDVVPVHADEYNESPPGSKSTYLYPPGWAKGRPDLTFNGGKNLATFADDVALPVLRGLVTEGRGPAAIIAGSRGGQVTIPRLWTCGWRGPTVVINGGCVSTSVVPGGPVRLVLITGGRDFFPTKDPSTTARVLRKEDHRSAVVLYHHATEPHMPRHLGDGVLERLLKLACVGNFEAVEGSRWPEGAELRLL